MPIPELADGRVQAPGDMKVLLIEDSIHFQSLESLLVEQHFPAWQLHVANDGITGLAMYGQIQPDILIVDILLPGIDGAALITTLRSPPPQFARSSLIVVTSLDESHRAPFAFARQGVNVIHKLRLVAELPALPAQNTEVRAASWHSEGSMTNASVVPVRRVFLVEDEASIARFINMALEDQGVDLTVCGDVESALTLLQEGPVGLVITDLMLPGLSGFDLLDRLNHEPALCGGGQSGHLQRWHERGQSASA